MKKKRAAFPFQSHIVLSGNVYLDVNQPAKVLHPASVWRVGLLALQGGNWVEEIGTLGMSETESHIAVWVTSFSLHQSQGILGVTCLQLLSTPPCPGLYGAFVIRLIIVLLQATTITVPHSIASKDVWKGAHPRVHKEHAEFPCALSADFHQPSSKDLI